MIGHVHKQNCCHEKEMKSDRRKKLTVDQKLVADHRNRIVAHEPVDCRMGRMKVDHKMIVVDHRVARARKVEDHKNRPVVLGSSHRKAKVVDKKLRNWSTNAHAGSRYLEETAHLKTQIF